MNHPFNISWKKTIKKMSDYLALQTGDQRHKY